jgi:hypothetical protein
MGNAAQLLMTTRWIGGSIKLRSQVSSERILYEQALLLEVDYEIQRKKTRVYHMCVTYFGSSWSLHFS